MNQPQDKLQLDEPRVTTFDREELDEQATVVAAY